MSGYNERPVPQLYRPAASFHIRPKTAANFVQECHRPYAEAHGCALTMDVFRPLDTANGFGVMDVVSGGWYGDRIQLNEHIGMGFVDALCSRGFTVFAVFPGSITKFTGFDMVRHVKAAIRWVKESAGVYGIARDRLAIAGASAGGHLAALAALDPSPASSKTRDPFRRHDTAVCAAGLFFAPSDLMDFDGRILEFLKNEGIAMDRLLFEDGVPHGGDAERQRRLELLSPARQVHATPPPMFLIHGDEDPVVPVRQSEKLRLALLEQGGKAELLLKKGGRHAWPGIREEAVLLAEWLCRECARP